MNPRVHLREWFSQDISLLQEASRDGYVSNMIGIHSHCTPQDARNWIERRRRSGKTRVIVESSTQQPVGEVGLDTDRSGSWGQLFYWVLARARGRGLVTQAAELLLRQSNSLIVTAFVSDRNLGSRRVLEKLGFVRAAPSDLWAGYPGPRDTYSYFRLAT